VDLVDFWGTPISRSVYLLLLLGGGQPPFVERLWRFSPQNLQEFFRHFLQHLRQPV